MRNNSSIVCRRVAEIIAFMDFYLRYCIRRHLVVIKKRFEKQPMQCTMP